jgi:hypothetical protein
MRTNLNRLLLCAALLGWAAPASAQEHFGTPDAAVDALVVAARSGDAKAILAVLGPDGQAIVRSGDPVADRNTREKFVAQYDAKHAIEPEGDGTQTLIIGDDDWPFPIPLVNKEGEWQFDTGAGLDEILRRRVGRNELSSIEVARAYVQAQNEYAVLDPAGLGRGVYAQRIVSHPERRTGSIGRPRRGSRQVRSASLQRERLPKATRPATHPSPTTAITIAFSPARARARPAAPTTIWSRAR